MSPPRTDRSQTGEAAIHLRRPDRSPGLARLSRRLASFNVGFLPEQIDLVAGLRAGCALAIVVVAMIALDEPSLSWTAFAAFWTCLADPGGAVSGRLRAMGGFAVAGSVAAFTCSACGNLGLPAVAAVMTFGVFLASLATRQSPAANQAGTLASVVVVVACAFPNPPNKAAALAGYFALGCCWSLLFCLLLWRIYPLRAGEKAIAAVYDQLEFMALDLIERKNGHISRRLSSLINVEHRSSIRASIERARGLLDAHPAHLTRALSAALDAADHLFAGMICLGHDWRTRSGSPATAHEATLVAALREIIREIKHVGPPANDAAAKALAVRSGLVAFGESGTRSVFGNWRRWILPGDPLEDVSSEEREKISRDPHASLWRAATNADVAHAGRVSLTVLLAFGISGYVGLTYSYWATMATVVVMQPAPHTTFGRSAERMLGSIVGGGLAAILADVIHGPIALVCLILPLASFTIAVRWVNYTLFVSSVTPLFILITQIIHPAKGVVEARVLDNVLGSLIGTLTILTTRTYRRFDGANFEIQSAIEEHLLYTQSVLQQNAPSLQTVALARRNAGISSARAEARLPGRYLMRPRKAGSAAGARLLLATLRDLAGATTSRWLDITTTTNAAALPSELEIRVCCRIRSALSLDWTPSRAIEDQGAQSNLGEALIDTLAVVSIWRREQGPLPGPTAER